MSFYVIWVCFSFWSLAARCFYETLGEAFCLIRSVCTCYPFICLLSSRDARYKPYFIVITAVTVRLFMCFHLVLFRYLLARFCRQGGKSTPTIQILPNLVQLLWQVTNQAVLCLIQHFVCWNTESCGWNSETINLTGGKTSQGKESCSKVNREKHFVVGNELKLPATSWEN